MNLRSPSWPIAVLSLAMSLSVLANADALAALLMPPMIVFQGGPFPVETRQVKVGKPVIVTSKVCVNTFLLRGTVATTITRELVPLAPDQPTLKLPTISGVTSASTPRGPDGCTEARGGESLIVPRSATPGMYYFIGTITWDAPWRHGVAHWRTQTFEVLE